MVVSIAKKSIIACKIVMIFNLFCFDHELWWQAVSPHNSFVSALYGPVDTESRITARAYIKKMKYASMLDVPCGFCADYFGLQQENILIEYTGVDIAPALIAHFKKKGLPVVRAPIENLPFKDNQFEISYSRHLMEHLAYYKKAISELIRVAQKEVLIIFSHYPWNAPDKIDYWGNIYINRYNKKKLECYITQNKKVKNLYWEPINRQECMVHIFLK